jgi:hypothetical protein
MGVISLTASTAAEWITDADRRSIRAAPGRAARAT